MAPMSDPFGGGFDPGAFGNVPLFRELQKLLSWTGGPVDWNLATETAVSIAAPPGALPAVGEREDAEFAAAVGTAELWLDQVTALPAAEGTARALSTVEWARMAAASDGLGVYVEPVATGMSSALTRNLPEQLQAYGGQLGQMMGGFGAMMYGAQAGTVAGHLATQMLATYDLGVPITDPTVVATVGTNVERFATEYDFEPTELRYCLALREAALRRAFAGSPWLRPHVGGLIGTFAAEADFNPEAMLEGMGGMGFDPSDPEAIQRALEGPDAFRIEPTTAQLATLRRLKALVSFVEGWSETVMSAAAADRLPAMPRIAEALRRRRAEKGPGEQALEQIIGLDLKPDDVRTGPAFCAAVIEARGQEGLDRAWASPEALPGADELAEPSRWLVRMAAAELDAEIGPDGR